TTVARSGTLEHRLVKRAQILLRLDAGDSHQQIRRSLGVSTATVHRWARRHDKEGLGGLRDEARSGKPRTISESVRQRIVHLACSNPTDGYTTWSQQRIADAVGVSKTTVHKVLAQHALKP